MENKIIITSWSLETSKEESRKMQNSDLQLIEAINDIKQDLEDIEIFDQWDNILITSDGYIAALYESDIEKVNNE